MKFSYVLKVLLIVSCISFLNSLQFLTDNQTKCSDHVDSDQKCTKELNKCTAACKVITDQSVQKDCMVDCSVDYITCGQKYEIEGKNCFSKCKVSEVLCRDCKDSDHEACLKKNYEDNLKCLADACKA